MTDFLTAAREQGTKVLLDVSLNKIGQAAPAVFDCIPLADVFTPNRSELLQLTGASSLDAALATAGTLGYAGGRQDGG